MIKRVYLIEDEPMVLDFCCEYIQNYTDMEIVGTNGNGHDGLREVLEAKPEMAIVDIRLPDVNGLEILSILKRKLPDCKVLMFTATVSPHTVQTAIQGGVDAFVEKSEGIEGLRHAIDALRAGKRYFSPYIKRIMMPFDEDLGSHAPFPNGPRERASAVR